MTSKKIIYFALSGSLLLSGLCSKLEAWEWQDLTEGEQRVLQRVSNHAPALLASTQNVLTQASFMNEAGRAWATKKVSVQQAVAQFRGDLETFRTIIPLVNRELCPHFSPAGLAFLPQYNEVLAKFNASFTQTNDLKEVFPRLGLGIASLQAVHTQMNSLLGAPLGPDILGHFCTKFVLNYEAPHAPLLAIPTALS